MTDRLATALTTVREALDDVPTDDVQLQDLRDCMTCIEAACLRDDLDFASPPDCDRFIERVRNLRTDAACADCHGVDLVAKQHHVIALDLLSQAICHLTIANLAQARGIAQARDRYP